MNLESLETRQPNSSSKKLYTGFANLQIVAVNPTREEIAKLYDVDVEKTKEPNYFLENSTRIDFWYRNHTSLSTPLLGKFCVFISKDYRVSQSGKNQYIDAHSRVCWADSISDLSARNERLAEFGKLNIATARQAYKGEEDLLALMKAYGNVDITNGPFALDDFIAIVKGNVKELCEFFDHFNKREGGIKVLLGVKDGQYQDVCSLVFLPVNGKITDYVNRRITASDYGYKQYYGYSFDFKEFVAEAEPVKSEENFEWGDPLPETKTTSSSSPFTADEDIF
jgi:hypothetical protein